MATTIETPSGKDAAYENFPVASYLLSGRLRPHVACFYNFARAADDIADNPELEPEEKIRRLNGFEATLTEQRSSEPNYQKANEMAASLEQTGVSNQHCRDLLAAFKLDAVKSRYKSWSELIAYCRLSAVPVGRFLIDLHGGSRIGYWPSDALCAALQLINHLQDAGEDYRTLDRIYLPMDWISDAGMELDDLGAKNSSPALRQVMDWTLIGVDSLLLDAAALPSQLYSIRLGLEASVIIQIARSLSRKLARKDPLSERIKLTRFELAVCSVRGIAAGLIRRW